MPTDHPFERLEFDRVCAAIAGHAECERARRMLADARPIAEARARAAACERLREALIRHAEPGPWCAVGVGSLEQLLDPRRRGALDGEALVLVRGWMDASADTRRAWREEGVRQRHPRLTERVDDLPDLEPMAARLRRALDDDGAVRDEASPALARARRGVRDGERRLHQQLERWSSAFGEGSYVTRHGDRFVALVPAAGFARRRGIVHDTSNSGQSLFVEPLEACEGNNALIEMRATASEEERRVLRELSEAVWELRDVLLAAETTLATLDDLRARARWAALLGGIALAPEDGPLRLVRARHPLLAMGEHADRVVPLDLDLDPEGRLLLVSGPNMGGKTVLLKTVGLAVLMAHAALPVLAAEGSTLPVVHTVLVDLGDEQSVDQGLSTFAAHLRRLRAMTDAAGPGALLLVDELGAGTDPEEGAALGRSLLEHFAERRAWGVITTHLGSLKRVAGEVPGIVNGSLEFDRATLRSRFRFVPGVPGASHALDVAGQLGFPASLLERARGYTSDETRALERLLSELGELRSETMAERDRLEQARRGAEAAAQDHQQAAEETKRSLAQLRRQLTAESETLLARARGLWQDVQRESKKGEKSRERTQALRDQLEAVDRAATELRQRIAPEPEAPGAPPARIAPGVRVRVVDLGLEAEVVSDPSPDGRVQLQRGSLRITSHVDRLVAVAASSPASVTRPAATYEAAEDAPAFEVDLRGMEADEAVRAVDQALDRAVLSGFHELRIIHGIGRGVLQAAVQRHLRGHPQVESHRLGVGGEGGRGATVARLR